MCAGAMGTQTGGSLVRPASYCGIAALKPTFGRVPTEGIVPVSYHLDHPGPMARWVDDLADIMAVFPAGSRVTLDVLRDGRVVKIDVVLGERDLPADALERQ